MDGANGQGIDSAWESIKFNIIEERPLNARKSARRVQCVCQNEVEKIRRAYCLNPKSFGLMTPILPLRVSLEGGAG